jgi:signal transduction histidine kinase
MDHLQKFAAQVRSRQALLLLLSNGLIIGGWWYGSQVQRLEPELLLWVLIAGAALLSVLFAVISTNYLVKPLRLVWQAVMHVAPETANVPPPTLKSAHVGSELLTSLVNHVYQLASVVQDVEKLSGKRSRSLKHDFVANSLPLPLVVLDKNQTIVFANKAMADYIGLDANDITGQNVYTLLDMSFSDKNTLDAWLAGATQDKAVDSRFWERVRLRLADGKTTKQFDLAAYYNKNNPAGYESMLVLFDHTQRYGQDDQSLGLIALAVHELRSPVTLLRGYIEALEEELDGKLNSEQADFMHKMKASAQHLTIFINNILNVARVENDQLTLKLQKEEWPPIIESAVHDMQLRARVRSIQLETHITEGLPPVGVDNMSMYEVLANLIDNAIKYSNPGGKVTIRASVTNDGLVETTVQDTGIGMPANIVSNLFEKFYRSHRSKAQVGGTGLGLYLCKSIVEAHGGNIWVRSKEGEGATFGFTVKPYTQVDAEQKNSDNTDIVRRAHGWIKNHSLYRG